MSMPLEERIRSTIREVQDFPKAGILFKDITPILQDPGLCKAIVETLGESVRRLNPDAIAGIESRGFLFGILLSQYLQLPFIPVRKAGKLPGTVFSQEYNLEYGSAKIEIPAPSVSKGMRIHIHDDLLATGGTASASHRLIQSAGGKPSGFSFLIELGGLKGRQILETENELIISLLQC
jgi:adenine phosphoribosyltransferase